MMSKLRSRKLWVAVAALVVSTVLVAIGHNPEDLIAIVGIVAPYLISQGWVDQAEAKQFQQQVTRYHSSVGEVLE